jgi:WD40 repeat protein
LPAGDIHIWDRESASYLHHIRAPGLGGDMTCIAWNPAADPFMFATGSHDGTVQIWTTPGTPPRRSRPPRAEVSVPQPSERSMVRLVVPVVREPSHIYTPGDKQNTAGRFPVAPLHSHTSAQSSRETLGVPSQPSNALGLRRHSWV